MPSIFFDNSVASGFLEFAIVIGLVIYLLVPLIRWLYKKSKT